MATDRRLSRNFRLREFPGWERATEEQVARLQRTVSRVLQPLRTAMGVPVVPTSWLWWSDGTPRTGSHAHGGTVDFIVAHGLTRDAWEWGKTYLLPAGYVGRWIYEPERTEEEGTRQGEHIHMAPVEAMRELAAEQGRPELETIKALEETDEGVYNLAFQALRPAALLASIAAAGFLVWALFQPRPEAI